MSSKNPKFLWGKENKNWTPPSKASESSLSGEALSNPVSDFASSDSGMSTQDRFDSLSAKIGKAKDPDSPEMDPIRTEMAALNRELSPDSPGDMDGFVKEASQPDGGGTWNPKTGMSPGSGFCYSPYEERSLPIKNGGADPVALRASIDKFSEDNKDLIEKPNHYIGVWNDPKDGTVYVDVSVRTHSAEEARAECEAHDQIAHFDLQTFNSVTVNSEAKSGQ